MSIIRTLISYLLYSNKIKKIFKVLLIASAIALLFQQTAKAWDEWGITYSGNSSIGNFIWTVDSTTGDKTKVSTKLFNGNSYTTPEVDYTTGDLKVFSGNTLHTYNLSSDTWTDTTNYMNDYSTRLKRGLDAVNDSSGNNVISMASGGTITLGGVAKVSDAALEDSSGNNIISKASDGSIHLGENSFITREYGGYQEIYATNSAGSAIDLNVTNGSDLLVNGTSVMGSIRGLADGVRATTALNAAFSAVPAMSGDRAFECGMGVGRYSTKNAIATACGARINDQLTANFGASFLPGGSESYLLGKMPAAVFRAGISFKFGKSYASSSANRISALNNESYNSFQLSEAQREASKAQREVARLRNKFASLESFKAAEVAAMKSLKAEVAEMKFLKAEVAEMKSLKAEVAAMKVKMAGLLGNRVVAMR